MKFPYESYPIRRPGKRTYELVHRPMIFVGIDGSTGSDRLFGLADTGADTTLFPDYLVVQLGVIMAPDDQEVIRGMDGGTTLVRYGRVALTLPGYQWSARVGFHNGFSTVLGHSGFLENFTATFNGRRRYVTLTPNGPGPAPAFGP